MSARRVVVTGIGPVSAVGIGRDAFRAALMSGAGGIAPIRRFDAACLPARLAAEVGAYNVAAHLVSPKTYLDRSSELALIAMDLAVKDARLDIKTLEPTRAGIALGTAFGSLQTMTLFFQGFLEKGPAFVRPVLFPHTYANTAISLLAMDYGLQGVHLNLSAGAVSSALAIVEAGDHIRQDAADVVFAGGCDALNAAALSGAAAAGWLSPSGGGPEHCAPFGRTRNGTILGEGACVLVLEEREHARRRGAVILGELVGAGIASDAALFRAAVDAEADRGLAAAMRQVLAGNGMPDCICAAANGGVCLDRNEAAAIRSVLGAAVARVPVGSIKALTGETMGPSAALQSAAVLALGTAFPPAVATPDDPDPELALAWGPLADGRAGGLALVNSADFGGAAVSLAWRLV